MSKKLLLSVFSAALVLGACSKSQTPFTARMEVHSLSANIVQFIPAPDQLPYCLIYTQTAKGVTRQMTMTGSNESVACPAGEPVLGRRFRLTSDEGLIRVRVLFSDQRLQAAQVASQVVDMASPAFNPMNLRLPGKVVLESIEYVPTDEPLPTVGEVVALPASDGGSLSGRH